MSHEQYENTLLKFFYGELSGEQEQEFRKHLDSCSVCQKELSELKLLLQTLDKAFDQPLKKEIVKRIITQAKAKTKAKISITNSIKFWLKPRWASGWAFAFLAVIAIGISVWLLFPEPTPEKYDYWLLAEDLQSLEDKFSKDSLIAYKSETNNGLLDLEPELEGFETGFESEGEDFYQLELDLYQIEIVSQGIFEI